MKTITLTDEQFDKIVEVLGDGEYCPNCCRFENHCCGDCYTCWEKALMNTTKKDQEVEI